jgi:hypothetical protein
MEASIRENRRHARYRSAQEAVLLSGTTAGRLCLITNFSVGGLCLAIVGSSRPCKDTEIDVKVNHGTFSCTILGRSKVRLHCKFNDNISENVLHKFMPTPRSDAKVEPISIQYGHLFPGMPHVLAKEPRPTRQSARTSPDQKRQSRHLSRIYTEGYLAGCGLIDPAVDVLEATVDVLNPYWVLEEKECWALGFKDAVCRSADLQTKLSTMPGAKLS